MKTALLLSYLGRLLDCNDPIFGKNMIILFDFFFIMGPVELNIGGIFKVWVADWTWRLIATGISPGMRI